MSVHLIHRSTPRHAALRDLLPDGGPAPLPRERRSWRAGVLEVLELLLFIVGLHPAVDEAAAGFDSPATPDILDAPPTGTAVRAAGVQLPRVRPGHVHIPHLPRPHVPVLAGRILHRGPRPAAVPGLAHVAAAVPAVPTAAGPTIGLYLPGDDPRTTTQQLYALSESALAALDLHYQALREACGRLDALALTPLPSEQPEPPRPPAAPPAPPALSGPARPPAIEYPPFATGSRRAPAPDGRTRYGQNALGAATPAARHAGRAADAELFGGAR